MKGTFYWHDYETSGTDPSRDRPVQFAGVRTDAELNIIGEPLELYCRPSDEFLPHPQACLVTGITPQRALAKGVPECEFIAQIHAQLAQPGTCGVGYNSIRFDDEVTRFTLYRNFFDAYTREYQQGNSRWDIIDMVRLTYALRPDGINWPMREDGLPSFKLEDLTQANAIGHAAAHDALSDVKATIAVARLIREQQPRLFQHVLEQRGKREVLAQLDVNAMKPVLHVSGMFGSERHNIALVVPLALHPTNNNEIICCDLGVDPTPLLQLDADQLRERLYTPSAQLPEGVERLGIKTIRINRCPIVVTPRLLDGAAAQRLQIDVAQCLAHRDMVRAAGDLPQKLQQVFSGRTLPDITDPDRMLYSGGFFADEDKRTMQRVRAASPEQLREQSFVFVDPRLPEMLFRYRARNFPASLNPEERAQWDEFRFQHLTDPDAGASLCMEEYLSTIASLQADSSLGEEQQALLLNLLEYADQLLS